MKPNLMFFENYTLNQTFIQNHLMSSLILIDKLYCLIACNQNQNCTSTIYNTNSNQCLMFSYLVTNEVLIQNTDSESLNLYLKIYF